MGLKGEREGGMNDFDGIILWWGEEGVFCEGVLIDGKGFLFVFVEVYDGKFGYVEVEEFDGVIVVCYCVLVFVDFWLGEVVLGVVCVVGFFDGDVLGVEI